MITMKQHSFYITHEGYNTQKEFDTIIRLIQQCGWTYRLLNAKAHLRDLHTPANYIVTVRKDTSYDYIRDISTGKILAVTGQTIRILVYKNK